MWLNILTVAKHIPFLIWWHLAVGFSFYQSTSVFTRPISTKFWSMLGVQWHETSLERMLVCACCNFNMEMQGIKILKFMPHFPNSSHCELICQLIFLRRRFWSQWRYWFAYPYSRSTHGPRVEVIFWIVYPAFS